MENTQADYFQGGLGFMVFILYFSASFFFGGIVCSEYSSKTGYIVFPKINRYKLLIGKFLGNLSYFFAVIGVYYVILALLGAYFYGFPINTRLWESFGFALLYGLTIASFVTFFSSFMKNVSMTIVACILILLIGFSIADQIIVLINPDIEPLYSLSYLSNLVLYVLESDFPTKLAERYTDLEIENFTYRIWLTPTKEIGVIMMVAYSAIFLSLSALLVMRKQL